MFLSVDNGRPIGIIVSVFAEKVESLIELHQRLKKCYLMLLCLKPPLHLGIVTIEKSAFGSQ